MNKIVLFLSLITFLLSCRTGNQLEDPPIAKESGVDVVILNEGNFGSGNASVDWYNSTENKIYDHIFRSNNQNRPIGDVVQSMQIIGEKGYIVVNNSQKIEVVSLSDFKSIGSIQGFNSPRYILPISAQKAYVSDLYADAISVINLDDRIITKTIPTNGWTEQMERIEDTAYVCDLTNNELLLIDLTKDSIFKRVQLIPQPGSIVLDKNNNLWVLCNGGFEEVIPKLYQINSSGNILQSINFQSIKEYPSHLILNDNQDEIYFLNNGVFKMSISDQSIPNEPFVAKEGRLFYSIGFHPKTDELYIADAIDYQQRGKIYRYNSNGMIVNTFHAGIIPTQFIFIP